MLITAGESSGGAGGEVSSEEKQRCYICPSDRFVDDHHYDCQEGKVSPETVPMCRRCHRTYHNFGVEWFDDEFLDKAIEIENKRREIWRANREKLIEMRISTYALQRVLSPMKREDVQRTDYWNKIHGIKASPKRKQELKAINAERQAEKQSGFKFMEELL